MHAVAVPSACSHTAERIVPVVVPAAAAATKLLSGHGIIDVAALHVLTTVTRRGWDAGVGACGSQEKLTTANEVCVRQVEVGVHRDCVKVSPCVAAAETVHAGTLGWLISCMEQCSGAYGCECWRCSASVSPEMVVGHSRSCAGWWREPGPWNSHISIARWRQRDASRAALGTGVCNMASPLYCSCDSGHRHAGLASSTSWQRAAEERYDDARELIVREQSRFLAQSSPVCY